ncbi:MAG TPA: response regulator transcription factor [Solimonas sp.]
MRLLLIEDNRDLAANIGEFLESRRHIVDYASDGLSGLHLAAVNSYDVVVLDLGLPGLDGVSLCKRLRDDARSSLPVLMLTARDTERDKLVGFDAGADDYLTKPFSLPELLARLTALQRRATGAHLSLLQVADLVLDTRSLVCRRAGRRLDLTPTGLRLLERLLAVSPRVVARRDVETLIWGDDPPDSDAALRAHIHALRQAIDRDQPVKLLHTVHGIGYRLGVDDDVA